MGKSVDIDDLEQKIRELKAIIRSLQKKLKKVSRGYNKHLVDEILEDDDKPTCPECTKGNLKETDILGRLFLSCTVCEYKGRK